MTLWDSTTYYNVFGKKYTDKKTIKNFMNHKPKEIKKENISLNINF